MTLTTHSIVGSALAKVLAVNPAGALAVGIIGHYLMDYIPHGEYDLHSAHVDPADSLNNDMVLGWDFVFDLGKIGFDFLLGLVLSVLFFYDPSQPSSLWVVLAGVAGGVLPDLLQLVYMKTRCEPFITLQKIHGYFHTPYHLKSRPYWAIFTQTAIILIFFLTGNLF